jgi:hypothetical protein
VTGPTRALAVLLATVAVLVTTTACTGDGALTTAEYRTRVAQVCRDVRRRTAALTRPASDSTDALVRAGRRALALQHDALGRIQSLDAPSAEERAVGRWLDQVDAALDATEASLDAQAAGDLGAARTANARGHAATARADALAHRLHVDDCTTPQAG